MSDDKTSPVNIGVFMPNGAQLLDMAAVDLFGVLDKTYLTELRPLLPNDAVWHMARPANFHYITTAAMGAHIKTTSGVYVKTTDVYSDAAVAPGKLDIVVVPGPDPTSHFEPGALAWLRAQSENPGTDIISICTGAYVVGYAGIADGREMSGPRAAQDKLAEQFPKVKFVGDKYRWWRDGNLWSSGVFYLSLGYALFLFQWANKTGHVTNGNDVVAAYARACGRWEKELVEFGLVVTGTGDRPQEYE